MGTIYMTTCLVLASRLVADSPLSRRTDMPHRIVHHVAASETRRFSLK
jgi:hypothetical protein